MQREKSQNAQDNFLNQIRKNKVNVTIFLVSGIQLNGTIVGFDNFSLLLKKNFRTQLVYKHAVSTVMPQTEVFPEPSKEENKPTEAENEETKAPGD